MIITIAGSRWFNGNKEFAQFIDSAISFEKKLYPENKSVFVRYGNSPGTDAFAKKHSAYRNYHHEQFKPNWDEYGSKAPSMRDTAMLNKCDILIVAWDGKSYSTKNIMEKAQRKGITLYTYMIPLDKSK